jgi:hypothetical protein
MATTTNYGWTTPDDTDLVKDGAAAIRTLGSSIDTTTKNLNPETTTGDIAYRSATANVNTRLGLGTAGQVLRVNSGATAPEWATTADQTPLTTKGDLFGFDTADARIPIGTNGHVLTADSAQSLGLKWAAPAGGGKVLQVIQDTVVGTVSTTSSSFQATGLSVAITPSAATSKVLVMVSVNAVAKPTSTVNGSGVKIQARRDTTEIVFAGDWIGATNNLDYNSLGSVSFSYLDSPATTSSTTYDVRFANFVSGQTAYINNYNASDTVTSTIIVMEIGA